MTRLSCKDYRNALDLVYMANRCQDIDGFINKLFPSMLEVFNAECITFQLLIGYPWNIKITESRSFKSDCHNISEDKVYPNIYKNNYFQQSPLLKEAIYSTKNVLKIGDTISCEEWNKSDMLNDFILPQHLYWELFLTMRWKSNIHGMVTLWRSQNKPNYGEIDVSRAELLTSHLSLTVNNIMSISRINSLRKHFIPNAEVDSQGLICLDNKFRPYFSNGKAREICYQLLKSDNGNGAVFHEEDELSVPLPIIDDCSALFCALKSDEPVLLSKNRILTAANGRQYCVECSLVWKADIIGAVPSFLVTMSELAEENGNKLENDNHARFSLSRREMDVIYYLIRGMNEEEIAERLYISKLTVHTHVKNIYKKLGAKSRIELYRNIRLQSSLK
jgi:DNA-binding CsgD family transcriptional regulator